MDLEPLKQRLAKATPGPWRRGATVQRTIYKGMGPDDLIGVMDSKDDAYLVVKGRTDLEILLALVEHYERALRVITERAREEVPHALEDVLGLARDALDNAPSGTLD